MHPKLKRVKMIGVAMYSNFRYRSCFAQKKARKAYMIVHPIKNPKVQFILCVTGRMITKKRPNKELKIKSPKIK